MTETAAKKSDTDYIPRLMSHIWIGPNPAPRDWMKTWQEQHPTWDYKLYDNDFLNRFDFRTQKLIDYYLEMKMYAGVADLMRYEILYQYGGFIAEADSICLHPVDDLLKGPKAHTIYESEFLRGKLVSPILACEPGNSFVGQLIDRLCELSPDDLLFPWMSTGNLFVANMIEELNPDIEIWPSHTMIPVHFSGHVYDGDEKVYAIQRFGTTRSVYSVSTPKKRLSRLNPFARLERRRFEAKQKEFRKRIVNYQNALFEKSNRWL